MVAISAMNENDDACDYSPARNLNALTMGASSIDDRTATFTNWGTCVDIFGPGNDIKEQIHHHRDIFPDSTTTLA